MSDNAFQINVLPAGRGDCIHLRFYSQDKWYNIVIDSGPSGKKGNKHGFANLMRKFGQDGELYGEEVDLLCFTHVDEDHIDAAECFFGNEASIGAQKYVKQVWMNVPEYEMVNLTPLKPSRIEPLTAGKAVTLCQYLMWHKIPVYYSIPQGVRLQFGDVRIHTVLPTPDLLADYKQWWVKERKNTTGTELLGAEKKDTNKANGSSIALMIFAFGKKMLFCGDAYRDYLRTVAEQWAGNGFDLVKLPHHGSIYNIGEEMLQAMKCRNFIISTDGKNGRPAQDTIKLLGEYGKTCGGVTVYGNYEWDHIVKWNYIKECDSLKIVVLDKKPITVEEIIDIRTE